LLEEILENAQATGEAAFSLSTSIIDIDTIHDSNIDPQLLQIDTQCKASAPGSITSTISQASSRLHTPMPYKRSNKSRLRPEVPPTHTMNKQHPRTSVARHDLTNTTSIIILLE
jgi:hypothetical protein